MGHAIDSEAPAAERGDARTLGVRFLGERQELDVVRGREPFHQLVDSHSPAVLRGEGHIR
jgi:hypothetical protein